MLRHEMSSYPVKQGHVNTTDDLGGPQVGEDFWVWDNFDLGWMSGQGGCLIDENAELGIMDGYGMRFFFIRDQ